MPSPFDERFARVGAPRLLAAFGETVIYTPRAGAGVELTGIVSRNETGEQQQERGRVKKKVWELAVPTTAEAASGTPTGEYVADPDQAAAVTIDGEEFAVRKVLSMGPLAALEIASVASMERTRPNFRQ